MAMSVSAERAGGDTRSKRRFRLVQDCLPLRSWLPPLDMHPRRLEVAQKTLVGSHQANAMASRNWRVNMFMLATSLGLSASSAGIQELM